MDENDGNSKENTLKFADNPSDLVPGVYEGGLKTWECSMDLVAHLQEAVTNHAGLSGKHILEVSRIDFCMYLSLLSLLAASLVVGHHYQAFMSWGNCLVLRPTKTSQQYCISKIIMNLSYG